MADTTSADGDGDGVGDVCDRCPQLSDAEQNDGNGDGIGDACQASFAIPGGAAGVVDVVTVDVVGAGVSQTVSYSF